jgi:hypothetical protein
MAIEESNGVEKEILLYLSQTKETNLTDLASSIKRSISNTYKIVDNLVEEDIVEDDYKRDKKGGLNLKERCIRLKKDKIKIKVTYKSFVNQQKWGLAYLVGILGLSVVLQNYLLVLGALIYAIVEFIKNAIDFQKDPDYRKVLKDVSIKPEEKCSEKAIETGNI